jgi:hypothetical protein
MELADRTDWGVGKLKQYDQRYIQGDPVSVVADGVLFDPLTETWLQEITNPKCVGVHVYDLSLAEAEAFLVAYRSGETIIFKRKYTIDKLNLPTPLVDRIEAERKVEVTRDQFNAAIKDKSV